MKGPGFRGFTALNPKAKPPPQKKLNTSAEVADHVYLGSSCPSACCEPRKLRAQGLGFRAYLDPPM